MGRPRLLSNRNQDGPRRTDEMRPELEPLEGRLVLSLVAVSASDAKINTSRPRWIRLCPPSQDQRLVVVAWNRTINSSGGVYEYDDVDARVYKLGRSRPDETRDRRPCGATGITRPLIAMDATGDFVIHLGAGAPVRLWDLPPGNITSPASPRGSTIVLNGSSPSGSGELPKVAMDSADDFVIAYQGYDATYNHGVFARRGHPARPAWRRARRSGSTRPRGITRGRRRSGWIRRATSSSPGKTAVCLSGGGESDRGSMLSDTIPPAWPRGGIRRSARLPARPSHRSPWSRPVSTSSPGNSRRPWEWGTSRALRSSGSMPMGMP